MRGDYDRPSQLLWLSALALIVGVYVAQVSTYWIYFNDDAFITLRFSRFLAMGQGPYFNIGQHVEGFTNPLLMLLMAAVIKLSGPGLGIIAAKSLGVLCGCLCIGLAYGLTVYLLRGRVEPTRAHLWASCAAALIAWNPMFALNSTSGLETTMFAFFVLLGVSIATVELDNRKWLGSCFAFAAAVWCRPEAPLLFAVFWLAQFATVLMAGAKDERLPTLRVLLFNGVAVTAAFVLLLGLRYHFYDGEWLPNTYYAKSGGFWDDAGGYVAAAARLSFFGSIGALAAMAGLFARRVRQGIIPVAVIASVGCLLPLVTGTDWMLGYRMIVPYVPLAACVIAAGWCGLGEVFVKRRLLPLIACVLGILVVLFMAQQRERLGWSDQIRLLARGYASGHVALAEWVREEAGQPGDAIALMDIGVIGYRCIDQGILDITGLTDRFIAKSEGTFLNKEYDPAYVLKQEPEFIVLSIWREGMSYDPLEPEMKFSFWRPIEEAIYGHPLFQKHYLRKRTPDWEGSSGLEGHAARIGATRIFEHAHPGMHYLLAVFERDGRRLHPL